MRRKKKRQFSISLRDNQHIKNNSVENVSSETFRQLPKIDKEKTICIYSPVTWPFMYRKFAMSLFEIMSPPNIMRLRDYGITQYMLDLRTSFPICRNRNEAVINAIKKHADYILFLDADMTHPPDIIHRLLQHNLPIVAGIYFHQSPPNLPVIYNLSTEASIGRKPGSIYKHYCYYPKDKLFKVDLTGMGCMLVDTRVFEGIDLPYFGYGSSTELGIVDITEDVLFCEKVRKAGFDIVIDPTVKCRHIYVGDVGEDIFDAFMKKYSTYTNLLEQFGTGIEGDYFDFKQNT